MTEEEITQPPPIPNYCFKRVLFLGIDNVLNSVRWRNSFIKSVDFNNKTVWQRYAEKNLDPDVIQLLNRVVEATDCVVVLSSLCKKGWGQHWKLSEINKMFKYRGFHHEIVDSVQLVNFGVSRGEKIDWWLRYHMGIGRFSIVDSDSDMEPMTEWLVQTNHEVGLTEMDVERIIDMLLGRGYGTAA